MKVVKPLNLSLLYRTYEKEGKLNFVVSVISLYSFIPPYKLGSEINLWKMVPEELGPEIIFDIGMPKPRSEVIVKGSFYSPGAKPVHGGKVRVKLGSMDKELHVFGNREWKKHTDQSWTITDVQPITELAITYENAYGGEAFRLNPLGKGHESLTDSSGRTNFPVPNITSPSELINFPHERIEPAGFGPYDLTWPQRFDKVGTYDDTWLKDLFPGFAKDFDPSFFNMVPLDQQFNGYLNGDEPIVCENMNPTHSVIQSRLPGIIPRCLIKQWVKGEMVYSELDLNLDTVWLFPHKECGVLIHRGQTEVADDQADDIAYLLLAYERKESSPRTVGHYQEALEKRIDPEKGHLYGLKEDDLIPEGDDSGFKDLMETAGVDNEPGLLEQHARNKARLEIESAKNEFQENGLGSGADFDAMIESVNNQENIDFDNLDVVVEDAFKKFDSRQEEMEGTFRELTESLGLNYDDMVNFAQSQSGGRMQFPAEEICQQMREFGSYTPEIGERLFDAKQQFDDIYRKHGHFGSPAKKPTTEQSEEMRGDLVRRYRSGEDLSGFDYTGVDLSDLNLERINLSNAFLEGADLSNTNLRGSILDGCMLAQAKLTGAVLDNSSIREVNLGNADLRDASFKNCMMDEAVLARANLSNTRFDGSNLCNADFMNSKGDGVLMGGTDLNNAQFFESILPGADFSSAKLSEAFFYQAELSGANFTKAELTEAVFVQSQADDCIFINADLTNVRAVMNCSFKRGNFSNSRLVESNLRNTDLHETNFTEADLSDADLSESILQRSCFYRALAKRTMFMKADLQGANMMSINLFEGSLQSARLYNTDLRGANLFAADLLKADFNHVNREHAIIGRTLLDT